MSEARASHRVWMGTLTFRPSEWFAIRCEAETHAARRAVDWKTLNQGERFERLQATAGRRLTLAFKRLRKAGHSFRYIATCEAHKSGVIHYHLIMHEVGEPIRKRVLETAWPHGFSKFKLVGTEDSDVRSAVGYVTKYVAKNGASRIRASIRYGQDANLSDHSREGERIGISEPGAVVVSQQAPDYPERNLQRNEMERPGATQWSRTRGVKGEMPPPTMPRDNGVLGRGIGSECNEKRRTASAPFERWDNFDIAALDATWDVGAAGAISREVEPNGSNGVGGTDG